MITINSQTNALRIVKNDSIVLSVSASTDVQDAFLTYSWKVKKNTVFEDVLNVSANTETMEVLPNDPEYGSFIFLCEITERNAANQIISGTNSAEIQVTIFNSRTPVLPSKARALRDSKDVELDVKNKLDGLLYNGENIGSPTLLDLTDSSNVESAIVDLATMQLLLMPVGTLIYNKSGTQPTAATQESTIVVSGTVSSETTNEPTEINIFGTRVSMPDGTIDTQLAEIVYQILLAYQSKNKYVNNVVKQNPTRVVFRYNDYKRYPERSIDVSGATVDVITTNEPSFCIGRWELLRTEVKVANNSESFTEYTWERVE